MAKTAFHTFFSIAMSHPILQLCITYVDLTFFSSWVLFTFENVLFMNRGDKVGVVLGIRKIRLKLENIIFTVVKCLKTWNVEINACLKRVFILSLKYRQIEKMCDFWLLSRTDDYTVMCQRDNNLTKEQKAMENQWVFNTARKSCTLRQASSDH